MPMPLLIEIAAAHLAERPRQTLSAVAGIALGAGFFIGIAALLRGFQHDFVAKLIDVAPHVIVKDEPRVAATQPLERVVTEGLAVVAGVRPRLPGLCHWRIHTLVQ